MTVAAIPNAYRLTYAHWLASPEDGLRREIIEGELFLTPPPSIDHQRISREIEFLLLEWLRRSKAGEVFDAPVGLRLSDQDVFEPDLVVVLHEGNAEILENAITGPADLVVEILSPGTARRDLTIKRNAYESFGVREYWIVDPAARTIEVLALESTRYTRDGLYGHAEKLTSRVLQDFSMALADVFPPPR